MAHVAAIDQTDDVMHQICAISDERRMTKPALAAISRMMRDEAMHDALADAPGAEALYGLLATHCPSVGVLVGQAAAMVEAGEHALFAGGFTLIAVAAVAVILGALVADGSPVAAVAGWPLCRSIWSPLPPAASIRRPRRTSSSSCASSPTTGASSSSSPTTSRRP